MQKKDRKVGLTQKSMTITLKVPRSPQECHRSKTECKNEFLQCPLNSLVDLGFMM